MICLAKEILKARTHTSTFAGSALELVLESSDSSPESADSTTDFMRVCRLPILNMFDILHTDPVWLVDYCRWPTANQTSGHGP